MIKALPYPDSVPDLFEQIADLPWPVYLDSAGLGRYDILAASPFLTLVSKWGKTEISDGHASTFSDEDPFSILRAQLLPYEGKSGFPFAGGAIGFFGYDLGLSLSGIATHKEDSGFPDLAFGLYDWSVVVDHAMKKAHLVSRSEKFPENLMERLSSESSKKEPFRLSGPIESIPDFEAYAKAFSTIKDYIAAGDCYQVNLARSFSASFSGDPWTLYRAIRDASPAPYSAYLSNPHCSILSASPERFLKVEDGRVETKPIKGTRPRSNDPLEDALLAQSLLASEKDRAENLMIVDLLRNDLGKACEAGTVKVDKLFDVEHFASVHHLVSTISGRLGKEDDALSLLEGAFPGGSITGAPKRRAMEIIDELEPFRRGPYCGSIARIGFDGNMDSNIMIRTLAASKNRICLWAGGGIVNDSLLREEYAEIDHKARMLLSCMESAGASC